jgi:hypothetical protein
VEVQADEVCRVPRHDKEYGIQDHQEAVDDEELLVVHVRLLKRNDKEDEDRGQMKNLIRQVNRDPPFEMPLHEIVDSAFALSRQPQQGILSPENTDVFRPDQPFFEMNSKGIYGKVGGQNVKGSADSQIHLPPPQEQEGKGGVEAAVETKAADFERQPVRSLGLCNGRGIDQKIPKEVRGDQCV